MLKINDFLGHLANLVSGGGTAHVTLDTTTVGTAEVTVRVVASVQFGEPPPPPPAPVSILDITFLRGDPMPKGFVKLSPAAPNIVKRPVDVVVGGATPITIDCMDPNASFDCAENDSVTATATGDVDDAGQTGPPSDPFTKVVSTGGGTLPAKPTITDIEFRPA